MLRYKIERTAAWKTAPPQTFAMGVGSHTLMVGTSAGAGFISHLRFAEGNTSCYFYTDNDPSTAVCTQCPADQGTITPQADVSSCRACETVGSVFDETTNTCVCRAGMTGGLCTPCGAATYKSTLGTGACSACPPGTDSPTGSRSIEECVCLTAYYAASDGVACTSCPANTTTVATGSTSRADCVCIAGMYIR
jgi:hypothetical protein